MVLDKTDLIILSTLAKNCRYSFSGIGSQVGLTSKSVKARVKKMMYHDVIEKFVVRVNPSIFGLGIAILLIKTSNKITKDEVIQRIKRFGHLAYHIYHMGRTCVTALIIDKPLDDVTIHSIKQHLLPANIINISILNDDPVSITITETDFRIIKCLLLLGARTEIADIAREVGISEKTTTRRLARMKEANLIDFSIQCSPPVMIGYIQFAIPIITTKYHRGNVIEYMYSKFQENILYNPSVIDSKDRMTFVLFAENVFTIDFILNMIISFKGVESADVYILTKWHYYDAWIITEIDNKVATRQPHL